MTLAIDLAEIEKARERVAADIIRTPLMHSPLLSDLLGREIFVKWDSKQVTGAFKERGAVNFLRKLDIAGKKKSVCAASLGNHAQGLSLHASRLGIPCSIFMPRFAPLVKVQLTEARGASVFLQGDNFLDAVQAAKEAAQEKDMIYVPPYDHEAIMAGQGTCALEILEQLDDFDSIVVPVGGGGLISGIATAVKETRPDVFCARCTVSVGAGLAQEGQASA